MSDEEDNQINEKEEEEENKIENEEIIPITYDKLTNLNSEDYEIIEGKLSTITHFQPLIYNPETYKLEEKLKIKNEKGETEYKQIPLENYIRWKYNQNNNLISNAKLIEWSDGTFQLVIGDKFFDVSFTKMNNVRYGIKINDNISLINQSVTKRMLISKNENDTLKMNYDNVGKSKVKVSYSYFEEKKNEEKKGYRYSRRRNVNKDNMLDKKRKRNEKQKNDQK